jgi:hypothetical protein
MIEMLNQEESPELNPVAVEVFERALKDVTPWVSPEYEGLLLPVVDLALVFETYYNLLEATLVEHAKTPAKKQEERRSVARLRDDMRSRLAPFDGGLIRLTVQ